MNRDQLLAKIEKLEGQLKGYPQMKALNEELTQDNDAFQAEIIRLTEFGKQQWKEHENLVEVKRDLNNQVDAYRVANTYLEDSMDTLDYKLKEANKEIIYFSHDRDIYYKALETIKLTPKSLTSSKKMRLTATKAIYR